MPVFIKKILEFVRKYTDSRNVLIYQMGKVGSSSLASSIKDSIQVHTLYSNFPTPILFKMFPLIFVRKTFANFIKRKLLQKRNVISIITIVRDPVERDRSMFFQDISAYMLHYSSKRKFNDPWDAGFDSIFNVYKNNFPHEYAVEWFDSEFYKFTGIDVYSHSYSRDKGWAIIEQNKFRVLILEMSKIKDLTSVIESFLGNEICLLPSNEGKNKWYSSPYQEFCSTLSEDQEISKIESLKRNSKFYKHFYGPLAGD